MAVLSTGDELVRIDQVPGPGQVRDINTWALSCYVKKTGLELVSAEAVKDEEVLLEEKIREAVKACDLILISGGSSQGKKDMTMENIKPHLQGGSIYPWAGTETGKTDDSGI